jgi:hypothetical protein
MCVLRYARLSDTGGYNTLGFLSLFAVITQYCKSIIGAVWNNLAARIVDMLGEIL